ncbi:MAG TPA: response regulator, partial [bacterium]|nr:response regulator [bacterium]
MENSDYKIIVVDDDNDICRSITAILKASGYSANGFNDSKSALKHISENLDNLPDIVITDYKLLGDNGLEFLEKLKNNYPEISVVMMTGYGDKELTVECLRSGAEDFLDKPLNPSTLRNSIAKLIKKRSAIFEMQKRKASSVVHEIANQLTVIKGNA